MLSCAVILAFAGCGRLGYELHELDAGGNFVLPSAGPAPGGSRAPRSDAGMQPTAANGSQPGPDKSDSGAAANAGAADGAACSGDAACASGACVAGVCCATRCDRPPECYVAADATCTTGLCQYVAALSGSKCDDGNRCTVEDRCQDGSCTGSFECDDGNACTQDFCGPGSCAHASTCQPNDVQCSYAERSGHGYWLCPGPVSFDAARAECKRIGAKLATVDDAREQADLWQLGMRDTWIGYRSQRSTGDDADAGFAWVDGDSDFQGWTDGDADLDAGMSERCAFISAAEQGAWQSRACDDAFSGFACEIEAYAAPEAGCRYERRGPRGYFSCPTQRTWIEAEQRCAGIGAYLVELDNAEEQTFVLTLLEADMRYAIGATDAQREGHFVTTRAAGLAFVAWAAGEPSAAGDYAMLSKSGTWQAVEPAQRGYYVCEQEL
jgi:hypothetical protein